MKNLTIADFRALSPCYDPVKYLAEDWTGTVIDLLEVESMPPEDRLWIALKPTILEELPRRLFAAKIARVALSRFPDITERAAKHLDTAEAFALGRCSQDELDVAIKDAADQMNDAAFRFPGEPTLKTVLLAVRAALRGGVFQVSWFVGWAVPPSDQIAALRVILL